MSLYKHENVWILNVNVILTPTCVCVFLMGILCWSGGEGKGQSAVSPDSSEETWLREQEAEDHRLYN